MAAATTTRRWQSPLVIVLGVYLAALSGGEALLTEMAVQQGSRHLQPADTQLAEPERRIELLTYSLRVNCSAV